eukprot:s11169_g1.t1
MPDWYRELWTKMGVRGAPLDQVDLQPMVESLHDEELQRYKESFEKLSRPNLEVYEQVPTPGKVMTVLDMRAQFGGKSVIWETAVTGGCVYVDVSPGLSGLAVHDPKMKDLGKPLPLWVYFAYTNNDLVKESLLGDDG